MNDRSHPNHPDHDPRTGEVDDGAVMEGEIIEPIGTGVLATIHRVEIDQQVATAKAYPRNVPMIKKELTALVTMDEETAEECIYALPRGGKTIKGPSARFADALISYWGNARSGAFVVQVDREEKFVEAIGSFQDVERNVIRQRRVRRPIADRSGRLYNSDMINMTGNAACVIAERNAILNGIPKSLWASAYDRAFALVAGTVQTLSEKIERAMKAFMVMGITQEQVLEKIGRADTSKIVPDDIVTMRGMLTALKTGEETLETVFGRGAGGHQHETVSNPLKDDSPASDKSGTKAEQTKGSGSVPKEQIAGHATEEQGETVKNTPKTDPGKSASTEGAKSDTAEKAAEEGAKPAAADGASAGNGAQAATSGPATASQTGKVDRPFTDAAGYAAFMRDKFDSATKIVITEFWGSTRADRLELLSREEIDALQKEKEAALAKLKGKG